MIVKERVPISMSADEAARFDEAEAEEKDAKRVASNVKRVNKLYEQYQGGSRKTCTVAIELGEYLAEMRDEHRGHFEKFVEENFSFTRNTAHRFIKAYEINDHLNNKGVAKVPLYEAHYRALAPLFNRDRDAAVAVWSELVESVDYAAITDDDVEDAVYLAMGKEPKATKPTKGSKATTPKGGSTSTASLPRVLGGTGEAEEDEPEPGPLEDEPAAVLPEMEPIQEKFHLTVSVSCFAEHAEALAVALGGAVVAEGDEQWSVDVGVEDRTTLGDKLIGIGVWLKTHPCANGSIVFDDQI